MAGLDLFAGPQRPLHPEQNSTFRLAPEPLFVDQEIVDLLSELAEVFHAFYVAANRLYNRSVRGSVPGFYHEYLDQGKPETVLEYARLNRFRTHVPVVIRPDVLITEQGLAVTELDSVPGGMGLLAFLMQQYSAMGFELVGGADGIIRCFAAALRELSPQIADPFVVVTVSDESNDYRGEMEWLAQELTKAGLRTQVCHPRDLVFCQDRLMLGGLKIDILYRFFELFDLKNIPQIDLILYAIRKEMVAVTPPLKHHLEEKLLFALLHHPVLFEVWREALGKSAMSRLQEVFPQTWIMDPRPLPPHAVIPDLKLDGLPVTDFRQLAQASQRERQLVIKPSGFSPTAWGSRGVTIGHDVSSQDWESTINEALAAFEQTPHILQEFHKGRKVSVSYYDFETGAIRRMHGRARLCPYYYVIGDSPVLAGILATVVPLNKKMIHGMSEAVMVPVAVK
ncbi:MAG: hypothetical protein GX162_13780 [Firmicutes bacterium]|nr:hypothetical protein [Bacillota bacterium]